MYKLLMVHKIKVHNKMYYFNSCCKMLENKLIVFVKVLFRRFRRTGHTKYFHPHIQPARFLSENVYAVDVSVFEDNAWHVQLVRRAEIAFLHLPY